MNNYLQAFGTASVRYPHRDDFRVAIICALWFEAQMVELMLDEDWDLEDLSFDKAPGDHNSYTLGSIGKHNVVLAFMPGVGSNSAVAVASGLRSTFPRLEVVFVVGICGVSPEHPETGEEIVLGDCVIGTDIVQYDFGKQYPGHFKRKHAVEDSLRRARPEIRARIAQLKTLRSRRNLVSRLVHHLDILRQQNNGLEFQYPGIEHDVLFKGSYLHTHRNSKEDCEHCIDETEICTSDCQTIGCGEQSRIARKRFALAQNIDSYPCSIQPEVHFGRYGSANTVMKSGIDRERLARQDDITAFEMEGSGVWELLPTIIIKAASDYADSHKSKKWQRYSAAVAAAGLKAVLEKLDLPSRETTSPDSSSVKLPLMDLGMIRIDTGLTPGNAAHRQLLGFAALDSSSTQIAVEDYHPDSGGWLFEHTTYKNWMANRGRILWLYGIPWNGKTVLCFKVLQRIEEIVPVTRNYILSFSFNGCGDQKQSSRHLLQAILGQIYMLNPARSAAFDRFVAICMQRRSPPSQKELLTLLMDLLHNIDHTYLVIDALDECEDSDVLLDMLNHCTSDHKLSIFMTSRQQFATEMSAEVQLKHWLFLPMSDSGVNLDIRRYVHHCLQDKNRYGRWFARPSILEKIEEEIVSRSNGCFKLAVSYLKETEHCLTSSMLESSLKRLPRPIDEAYRGMLTSMNQDYLSYAIRLLQFLTFWPRRLGLDETVDMLAVEVSEKPCFDSRARMPEPLDIGRICGNLIKLEKTVESDNKVRMTVQLAHPSIEQFLQSEPASVSLQQYLIRSNAWNEIIEVSTAYVASVFQIRRYSQQLLVDTRLNFGDFPFLKTALWVLLDGNRVSKNTEQSHWSGSFQSLRSGLRCVMHNLANHGRYINNIRYSLHKSRHLLYCARDSVWDNLLVADSITVRVDRAPVKLLRLLIHMVDLLAVEHDIKDPDKGCRWTAYHTPEDWTECLRMAQRVAKSKHILVPRGLVNRLSDFHLPVYAFEHSLMDKDTPSHYFRSYEVRPLTIFAEWSARNSLSSRIYC